jgi:rhodanese-related sulfurtransferase
MPVSLKLNFSKTDGRIYGGQAVGYKGVDKAVEVLSLCCQFGLTVRELKNMDQAYAPPYSSAKSPVNMLGFVAENLLTGKVRNVSWRDVQGRDFATTFLLDVRNSEEVALGVMPGAKHIPLHQLRARIDEVPKDRAVYVYCAVGLRAYVACRILMQRGYKAVYNITGGYKTWETATMKQSNEDVFEDYRITKDDDMRTVLSPTPAAGGVRVQEAPPKGWTRPGRILLESAETQLASLKLRQKSWDV